MASAEEDGRYDMFPMIALPGVLIYTVLLSDFNKLLSTGNSHAGVMFTFRYTQKTRIISF